MKPLLLTILVCLISLTAFAQEDKTDEATRGITFEEDKELDKATEIPQTKQDILKTYGEPYWQGGYKDIDVFYYPVQKMFIFFDKGKVVKIDIVTSEKI